MAVVLVCPDGHREAALKEGWPQGPGSKCGRCLKSLRVEREGPVRDRTSSVKVNAKAGRHPTLCTVCQKPLTEHRPFYRHPV